MKSGVIGACFCIVEVFFETKHFYKDDVNCGNTIEMKI